jgi:hypothetical protein
MQKLTLRYFYALSLMLCPFILKAQQNTLGDRGESAITVAPKHAKRAHAPKRKTVKYRKPDVKRTAVYEFYERVEQAAKNRQRLIKKLAKPQYSNPLYFGHKRAPKKHVASKMRYCKECGIRH